MTRSRAIPASHCLLIPPEQAVVKGETVEQLQDGGRESEEQE